MIIATFTKQPWEEKDYDIDYSSWLADVSDTVSLVSTSIVCVSGTDSAPNTLTVTSTQIDGTGTRVKLWVTKGVTGCKYKITVQMTTAGSSGRTRKDEVELVFNVKDT